MGPQAMQQRQQQQQQQNPNQQRMMRPSNPGLRMLLQQVKTKILVYTLRCMCWGIYSLQLSLNSHTFSIFISNHTDLP